MSTNSTQSQFQQEFSVEHKQQSLSYEYIRGLVDREGCFGFHSGCIKSNGNKYKIPVFAISMHVRDKELLVR